MEQLQLTYLIGSDSEMRIALLSVGEYMVTILPLFREDSPSSPRAPPTSDEVICASAVHTEYVVVHASMETRKTM